MTYRRSLPQSATPLPRPRRLILRAIYICTYSGSRRSRGNGVGQRISSRRIDPRRTPGASLKTRCFNARLFSRKTARLACEAARGAGTTSNLVARGFDTEFREHNESMHRRGVRRVQTPGNVLPSTALPRDLWWRIIGGGLLNFPRELDNQARDCPRTSPLVTSAGRAAERGANSRRAPVTSARRRRVTLREDGPFPATIICIISAPERAPGKEHR